MSEVDPYRQRMLEHMRLHLKDLKDQLKFLERDGLVFWHREGYGPRVDITAERIEHLKDAIAKTERAIANEVERASGQRSRCSDVKLNV
jgi:hypothetical protein